VTNSRNNSGEIGFALVDRVMSQMACLRQLLFNSGQMISIPWREMSSAIEQRDIRKGLLRPV
jgi:hypothetical protein